MGRGRRTEKKSEGRDLRRSIVTASLIETDDYYPCCSKGEKRSVEGDRVGGRGEGAESARQWCEFRVQFVASFVALGRAMRVGVCGREVKKKGRVAGRWEGVEGGKGRGGEGMPCQAVASG